MQASASLRDTSECWHSTNSSADAVPTSARPHASSAYSTGPWCCEYSISINRTSYSFMNFINSYRNFTITFVTSCIYQPTITHLIRRMFARQVFFSLAYLTLRLFQTKWSLKYDKSILIVFFLQKFPTSLQDLSKIFYFLLVNPSFFGNIFFFFKYSVICYLSYFLTHLTQYFVFN